MSSDFLPEPLAAEATPAANDAWRAVLYRRLANNATPVVQFPDAVRSAASLWAGARAWTQALRAAGMPPGHVVMGALPAGPALLQLLVACLWDGLTLVLQPADALPEVPTATADRYAARLVVQQTDAAADYEGWRHRPAAGGWPNAAAPLALRTTHHQVSALPVLNDGVAPPRTHADLFADLHDHPLARSLAGGRVVVALDWNDAGLLAYGVLLPLLVSDELFVVSAADGAGFARLLRTEPVTHLITADDVADEPPGIGAIQHVRLSRARARC